MNAPGNLAKILLVSVIFLAEASAQGPSNGEETKILFAIESKNRELAKVQSRVDMLDDELFAMDLILGASEDSAEYFAELLERPRMAGRLFRENAEEIRTRLASEKNRHEDEMHALHNEIRHISAEYGGLNEGLSRSSLPQTGLESQVAALAKENALLRSRVLKLERKFEELERER